MGSIAREQQQWVVQPLIDAGVDRDQVVALVFRLAFEGIVTAGHGTPAGLAEVVADQPPEVQQAWTRMVGRLLLLEFA